MSFGAYVWGWPFRLSASRVHATRHREPTLFVAGPDISLVAFERRFFGQNPGCLRCFPVCIVSVNFLPVSFFEIRSRGCSVVSSCRVLVDYIVEIREAATRSRFSEFLLALCKAGFVHQPSGGEH